MKITVLGATGMAGAAIVQEASRRGHRVTAVSRHPHQSANPLVISTAMDLSHPGAAVAQVLAGADAVVLALRMAEGEEARLAPLTARLLDEAGSAHVRTLVVGGAGPLRSPGDPRRLVVDDPAHVQPRWRPLAAASVEQFNTCTQHQNQDWVYLSPAAVFEPGPGVGAYRRGGDTLLLNRDGISRVTPPDLALAVLDELEHPGNDRHFTVIAGEAGSAR